MIALLSLLSLCRPAWADIKFINGPATVPIGDEAEIKIEDGWRFVPKESMKEFDEKTKNLYNDTELGVLIAPSDAKGSFWAFFTFDPIGYIKDAASEKLDADSMWSQMTENSKAANEERKKLGYPEMNLLQWVVPPKYNPADQRLEWSYSFGSRNHTVINYNTRILGRKGVMEVVLVPNGELDASLPLFNETLMGFDFRSGSKYSEYIQGDKLAEAGLAALVVGGLGAAAASTGLLAKMWKFIVLIFVAVASRVKAFWKRLFPGKDKADGGTPPPGAN